MPERISNEYRDLLQELGVDAAPAESGGRSARDQRIIAGFEEIERFVEEHGRAPEHGENRDIFERLYAVRLDRLRDSAECREVLRELDTRGLLAAGARPTTEPPDNELSDDELLASLGVDASAEDDVTQLVHVRSRQEIKAAEDVARRAPCTDFDEFRPLFEQVQRDLETDERRTVKYGGKLNDSSSPDINKGDWFILEGQKLLVAAVGEEFVSEYDRVNRRLRVVYDNGTESDPLQRSLQRALYEDKTSRRITEPGPGPLFADIEEEDDSATGYVYVLRSKSDHPFVAEHRDVIHKIGVTGGEVKSRIANAKKDPTYLLADVEIVATFKLANIDRKALEALLQRFFGSARLDLQLKDRFGSQVEPREWFLVPLPVIDETINRIKDGTISDFRYAPESASLAPA
jgi:hypothetical protein